MVAGCDWALLDLCVVIGVVVGKDDVWGGGCVVCVVSMEVGADMF